MTLCMAWRSRTDVHFASDSRLMFGLSSADVGVKVLSIPYRILSPANDGNIELRSVAISGELGMCFAGSTVNSLTIKESVVEILKSLQYAPGYTDRSMAGIVGFIFKAYKLISRELCKTNLADKALADIILGGLCPETNTVRVFLFSTDMQNNQSMSEILQGFNSHHFIGTGTSRAELELPQTPSDLDYLNILKLVIDDPEVDDVGGNIQYGVFRAGTFVVYGVIEIRGGVHYWRGALDLNGSEFMTDSSSLIPAGPYIDPFSTVGI